jgi:hypothetical protein
MSSLNSEKLTSYFAGQDASGAGSNYFGMCAAVLAVSHASVDCRACSGKGYRELSADDLKAWGSRIADHDSTENRQQVRRALSHASDCAACQGSGKVTARRTDHASAMDSMFTTVRCGLCRGCGETTCPTDTSAERGDVCLGCGGASYIVPVTVKETGSTKDGKAPRREAAAVGDFLPDNESQPEPLSRVFDEDVALERQRMALELQVVRAQDPQLADALASYRGPESEPWVQHRWGRGFVVWQHTPAGKLVVHEVAEQSERRAGHLVAPTRLLALARDQLELPGDAPVMLRDVTRLRVLMARADREARDLLRRLKAVIHQVESAA